MEKEKEEFKPFVPAEKEMKEFSITAVIVGVLLAVVFGTGNILWSWHVWVTDYHPDASGTETVLTPETKRKLKLVPASSSDGTTATIIMDRNLGAYEAAVNAIPKDMLTMSRNNGQPSSFMGYYQDYS